MEVLPQLDLNREQKVHKIVEIVKLFNPRPKPYPIRTI